MNLGSTEFFIDKAIGWALREYGNTSPKWFIGYAEEMGEQLHPLSKREALKNLK